MAVSRPFIWECDRCPEIIHKHGYGLPKGWNWLLPNRQDPAFHICEKCKKPGDRIGKNK